MPENKATLTGILTYHVVAGTMTSKQIAAAIKAGGGKATLRASTAAGDDLAGAYTVATAAMIDGLGGADAKEGIDAFLGKRPPQWKR